MGKKITIEYESVESLVYKNDGNYHIKLPTFYEFGSYSNNTVDFIFDTGAYMTVIDRKEAALLGYLDSYTIRTDVPLSGFVGGCLADIKEIPGFIIGGHRLEGVKVAVPQISTDANILGLNVIELFKYYVDTEDDKIYFSRNTRPDIPEPLRCKNIYSIF